MRSALNGQSATRNSGHAAATRRKPWVFIHDELDYTRSILCSRQVFAANLRLDASRGRPSIFSCAFAISFSPSVRSGA